MGRISGTGGTYRKPKPQAKKRTTRYSAKQRSPRRHAQQQRDYGTAVIESGRFNQTSGQPSAEEIAAGLAGLLGGSGGGGGGLSAADEIRIEQERARLAAEETAKNRAFEAEQQAKQREFEAAQAAKQRELERQSQLRDLKQQRQAMYVELVGRDPARAILFAMGIGPEADKFNTAAKSLGATLEPLAGAQQSADTTSSALSGLLGGANVKFGAEGITGLSPAHQAAKSFVQGGADARNLLTSAYGVGSTGQGGQPGISADRLQELVQSVTPQGLGGV